MLDKIENSLYCTHNSVFYTLCTQRKINLDSPLSLARLAMFMNTTSRVAKPAVYVPDSKLRFSVF